MTNHKKYLTIHGHFYQPPRENPWIEEIELQESAAPNHDWNEKISAQCYSPNSVSRIVDGSNSIIEISNNYKYISFNFGPTLLSWMEKFDNQAYRRIIQADIDSRELYGGHGNAIAQVYNHIILPLANRNDKITQVIWGLKDFQKRFKRNSEGIWLAETAVDAQTLEVLIDCGVKFTILSPHQAKCINKMGEHNWQDVSWGQIDPSQPYRYYVEGTNKEKYIDLFFYDGSISKSVAFDNLLCDGRKFSQRLNDGYVEARNRAQLINIATDGESYGHHTKFGDMALAYVVRAGAKNMGFEITNYGQFLEMFPPQYEVDIKPVSAWSCSHGVGRWMDDCGCSTGAQPHWNQKWRKPLRQALDYLRDELVKLCSIEGSKYYKDFWEARNNYIDVILDRSEENINLYLKQNANKRLNKQDKVKALKLMEIQRFCQLMYTSCGWFFADISGIETTQILKYAARAMQLAAEFTKTNYEKTFLSILQKAKSNIYEFGNGKTIYENWVKSSVADFKHIAAQAAIEAALNIENQDDTYELYCFKIKQSSKKTYKFNDDALSFVKLEITSKITLEKKEYSCVILQTKDCEFYCSIKDYVCPSDFALEKKEISKVFSGFGAAQAIRTIHIYFGKKMYSLKDIPIDKRKIILENLILSRLKSASKTYHNIYQSLLAPISNLNDLGMDIPEVFRVCAKYTLLSNLDKELGSIRNFSDKAKLRKLTKIKFLTEKFNIKLTNPISQKMLSQKLDELLDTLGNNINIENCSELIALFELIDYLKIDVNIQKAQNEFWAIFCEHFDKLCEKLEKNKDKRQIFLALLEIGEKLKFNTGFYKEKIDTLTGKI